MTDTPAFSAMTAVHLAHGLVTGEDKEQAPAILEDWKGYLVKNFALKDEQRAWIDSLDHEQTDIVTRVFQKIIDSNGKERLVVTMIADHAKPGGMYHELRTESLGTRDQGVTESLRDPGGDASISFAIAHCDANCRNWGWGAP